MKIIKYMLGLIVVGFFFMGCSSRYSITYNSNPTGASIVCNGINYGYSPVTLYYDLSDYDKKHKELRTVHCAAYWISGAIENYSTTWDLDKFPEGVMQTVQRPNMSGYEQDMQFSLQVQQMKAQQAQADAAQQQANQQALQNMNQSIQNMNNNLQMQQHNYQMQNLNNNLNNINRNLNKNNGGYYNGGGYYNNR